MRLHIHKNLREVVEIEATRVVVEDDFGNPIALALEFGPNQIIAVTAEDPKFNQLLSSLGIDKVVVVHDVPQTPLNEVRFDG